jgi:DHA1 family multidrug resistance protein-like MFS transporter
MNTQLSHAETQSTRSPRQSDSRKIVSALSICMALQMTSFVMILPLFARRFTELGAGVEALSFSAMAYALTSAIAAPFMGALSDRFGRRPLVLVSLAAYILAFIGYLFAPSAQSIIYLRGMAGAFTAGLVPAVIGIVADLAPVNRKAQWIGIVNGGASIGWIVGPVLGGTLYDHWGYEVSLIVSIMMAITTFITALLTLRNVRETSISRLDIHSNSDRTALLKAFCASLPDSLSSFSVLLGISFTVLFAWAFIEPRFMFYAYDSLEWNSSTLGLMMSTYGIAMMLGEFTLSRLSDRIGRKPVILIGLLMFSAQFIGLAFSRDDLLIAAAFIIAGFGNALYDPALSAYILDITPIKYHGQILGIKSMAGSLGSILGPALVVLFTEILSAQGIFMIAMGAVLLITFVFLFTRPKLQSKRTGQVSAAINIRTE